MFAIDHAATALLLKRKFPQVAMVPLLVSVQLMELVWVALNLVGVERVETAEAVRTVADIHLAHMPWSHSVATMLGASLLAWAVLAKGFGRPALGLAVGLGIASHLALDLLTHAPDIALAPGLPGVKLGLGLYGSAPMAAFAVELLYGVLCWWVFRGGKALLAVIVAFNAANLSMFSAAIAGPERWMAGRPDLVAWVVLAQIAVTLALVGLLARGRRPGRSRAEGAPAPGLPPLREGGS